MDIVLKTIHAILVSSLIKSIQKHVKNVQTIVSSVIVYLSAFTVLSDIKHKHSKSQVRISQHAPKFVEMELNMNKNVTMVTQSQVMDALVLVISKLDGVALTVLQDIKVTVISLYLILQYLLAWVLSI